MISHKTRYVCLVICLLSLTLLYTLSFSQEIAAPKRPALSRTVQRAGPTVSPAQPLGTTKGKPMYAPGEIVVRYFDNANANDKSRVRAKHSYIVKRKHKYFNAETLKVPTTMSADAYSSEEAMRSLCAEIMKDPAVKYAEPNFYVYAQEGIGYYPNDPLFSSDTFQTFSGETLPPGGVQAIWSVYTSIDNVSTLYNYYTYTQQFNLLAGNFPVSPPPEYQDVLAPLFQSVYVGGGGVGGTIAVSPSHPGAWDFEQGSSNVKVAVLDTGVMYKHEDLIGKFLAGYDYVNESGSYVGGIAEDDNGHGTHVAGLIAAKADNYKGVVGCAPNVMIIPIKVLDAGGTGTDDVVSEGIIGAVDKFHANVLNMSFGGATLFQMMEEAVNQVLGEGAVLVAAAGNNGTNFSSDTLCTGQIYNTFEPALIPGVISVGSWEYQYPAADTVPIKVGYSNYGFITSAPTACYTNWGVKVFADGGGPFSLDWSTYLYPLTGNPSVTTKYQPLQGTSMASPQVAGLAALLYSKGIQDSNAITAAIESSCWDPMSFGAPNTWTSYTISYQGVPYLYTQYGRNSHPEPEWGYGAIDALAAMAGYQASVNLTFVSDSIIDCASSYFSVITSVGTGTVTLYLPTGYTGNCNNILDPGETVGLNVELQNTGSLSMTNIVGVLRTSDIYTQIISNTVNYPDTGTGNVMNSQNAFVVSVSSSAPATQAGGYTVRFIEDVTFNTSQGATTFHIPIDIALSVNPNQFTSSGGVYTPIDLQQSYTGSYKQGGVTISTTVTNTYHQNGLPNTFINDTNATMYTGSLLPRRYETGVAPQQTGYSPTANTYDGYLETGETTAIYPNLINNSGTLFLGVATTYPQISGIYGTLHKYYDSNPAGLLSIGTSNTQIYYSYSTGLIQYGYNSVGVYQGFPYTGGAVSSNASTEFDYNLLMRPTVLPNDGTGFDEDSSYGFAILELSLHAPQDPTANWIDRFPVCYSEMTSIALDDYVLSDANADNVLEPGESATLKAYIRNSSPLSASPPGTDATVTADLTSTDPLVVISDSKAFYSTFANPGQYSGPDGLGFSFTVFPNTPQNHKINFNLQINASLISTDTGTTVFHPMQSQWNCPFVVEMGEVVLYDGPDGNYGIQYDDSIAHNDPTIGAYNNGNGQVNPGEKIYMDMSFWNRHFDQQLNGMNAYLTTTTPYVYLISTASFIGNISARSIISMQNPFVFALPPAFYLPQIDWAVTLVDDQGKIYVNTFSTPVYSDCPLPQVTGFPTATYLGAFGSGTTVVATSTTNQVESSPTLIDLYNTGTTDIIVGNDGGAITAVGLTANGPVYVPGFPVGLLDGNGNLTKLRKPIAIGDIDNSSTNSLVVVPEDGTLFIIKTNYGVLSTSLYSDPRIFNNIYSTPPVLADLNGDGAKDIIVGATLNFTSTSTQSGAIFAFDSAGNGIGFFGSASTALSGPIVVPPAVGYLLGGNTPDVVAVSQSGDVAEYDSQGRRVFLTNTGAPNNFPPILGDIEGTGTPDIIVKSTNGYLYAWRPDGTVVPGFPIFTNGDLLTTPILADIDQDGNPDIIVGATGNVVVINGKGNNIATIGTSNALNISAGAIDHSGYPQLFVTTLGGSLQFVSFSNTSGFISDVYCTDGSGFQDSTPGLIRFPNPNGSYLGGDNTNSAVVVTSRDGNIYAYKSFLDSTPTLDYWVEYAHDASHTNAFTQPQNTIVYATPWTTDNNPYKGIFYQLNGINWLSFHGIATHLYRITVYTPVGSTASPQITLYDPTALLSLGGPSSTKIESAVPTSDTYYVKVSNANNNYGPLASYEVSIYDVTAHTYIPEEMWKGFSD